MYVNGPGRTNGIKVGGANRKAGTASSGFSPIAPPSKAPAPSPASAQAIQGVEAILALQSVDDATGGRRRALQHGHDMLDVLEELHIDLISGHISDQKLDRLALLVSERAPSNDPEIDAVVAEIELRVRVELAKRNRVSVAS